MLLSSEGQQDERRSHHADVPHSCAPCGRTGEVLKPKGSNLSPDLQGQGSSCPHSRAGTFVLLLPHQRVTQPSANPTEPGANTATRSHCGQLVVPPHPSVGTYFIFLLSYFNPGCWGIVELLHLSALNKKQ